MIGDLCIVGEPNEAPAYTVGFVNSALGFCLSYCKALSLCEYSLKWNKLPVFKTRE